MEKVLFLINSLEGGGAEKVLTTIANKLVEDYDITILTIYNEGIYIKELNDKINYKTIIKNPTLNKKRILFRIMKYLPARLLHYLFIRESYDIEIGFLEGICTKIISAGRNTKTIGWIHTDLEKVQKNNWEFITDDFAKYYYSKLNKIICVSNECQKSFYTRINLKRDIDIVYNPINSLEILDKSLNTTCDIKKNKFTICAIGRLVTPKGFEQLIEAINQLVKLNYDINVWIFGDGALKNKLQGKIEEYNLKENVYLLGYKENVYPYLKASDLYVCSSIYEGFSLSVAEALVIGKPVLSTKCTGPEDLLENGKYGMLVENSVFGIFNGIKSILDDSELLNELQRKSIIRGRLFDIESTIDLIKEKFEE